MDAVEKIARTCLYEGYLLWPYRRAALKNAQRWTFGGVYPSAHTAEHPDDKLGVGRIERFLRPSHEPAEIQEVGGLERILLIDHRRLFRNGVGPQRRECDKQDAQS